MVQQNYIHRLAMGRSAFHHPPSDQEAPDLHAQDVEIAAPESFIQQYNQRGHAVNIWSRQSERRLRRAQNDILSTIGLLVPTTSSTRRRYRTTTQDGYRHRTNSLSSFSSNDSSMSLSSNAAEARSQEVLLEEFGEWSTLALSISCDALSRTATAFIRNQRRRIQTFSMYAGVPILRIIWSEARHQSFLSYWLASEAATWAEHVFELSMRLLFMTAPELLNDMWQSTKRRTQSKGSNDDPTNPSESFLERYNLSLNISLSLLLAPSTAIIALQRLQLITPRPLIPLPWRYSIISAYLALLPPLPTKWTLPSALLFCTNIPTSALGLSLTMEYLFTLISQPLTRYARAILPRPDNPDERTLASAQKNADVNWFLESYSRHQMSLKDEIGQDLQWLSRNVTYTFFVIRNLFVPSEVRNHRKAMLKTLVSNKDASELISRAKMTLERGRETLRSIPLGENTDWADQLDRELQLLNQYIIRCCDEINGTGRLRLHEQFLKQTIEEIEVIQQHARLVSLSREDWNSRPLQNDELENLDSQRPPNGPLNSHPIASSTPLPSLPNSSRASSPLEFAPAATRSRTVSSSTLQTDAQSDNLRGDGIMTTTHYTSASGTYVIEDSVTETFPANVPLNEDMFEYQNEVRTQHKVSAVSLLPSEILATILVQSAIGFLRLPLESLYLRKVASGFLGATASMQRRSVYPTKVWFGGADLGSRGRLAYAANVSLCLAIETAINVSAWTMVSRASVWMGRKWFMWGNL